ncbi:MAG TPA: SRPBCC domain-containing protein [Chitinophagaceae bacterium]|nr:SRPBCC domain-containing protein [Chitinophagaceae bacterium]
MWNGNLTKFIKRISINATPQEVFQAWCTQEGLETWFLRSSEFIKPDGSTRQRNEPFQKDDVYHWLWHGYGDDVYERREIVDTNGNDSLSFKFTGDCLVTVNIKTERGETICELIQDRIPSSADLSDHLYVLCGEGWTFYLTNLKSILEGGIDLRNKNMELTRVVNA